MSTLPTTSQEDPRESVRELTGCISKMARVHISDGRSFEGQFLGVDGHQNLLLAEALECNQDTKRFVGLVMVPGKYLERFEVARGPFEI
ncbi:hypothetical protein BJ684DRAFT_18912 [Piptocephalis cylindrospora]|uniref:Sm domain-containing protein n=1 Tax=Piptocephalis cylindrospora TaxID=1907219 RepID=A0A4P9Y6H6_9FUNG|nr:hypothetical protein BJ684DRAFT_18912 [Piptocephalis cylindrospora]|eukprot:RKP14696.1 hypothetical protein BJ684DRAFT_18912 [Piptocephalis cylindrospora]